MTEEKNCPGCGRHCDLEEPHCPTGEEYRRTGKLPENNGEGHHHHHGRKRQNYQEAGINEKLIINLADISHVMKKQYEGKASQKRILILLNENHDFTQKELTDRLEIKPGSASEILAKLENAGLIKRTQNEADRRTTDIQLTEEGAALATEAAQQRRQRHEQMFTCLSEEEQATLLSLLEKVRADWETKFGGAHDHRRHRGGHKGHGEHEGHGEHGGHEGRGERGERGGRGEHGGHRGRGGCGGNDREESSENENQ